MSVYMKNPLRSKDLDLLSSQVSLQTMEELGEELGKMQDVEYRTTSVLTRKFEDRKMMTYATELRVGRKPFFVEIFDKILDGRPLSLLQPYVEQIRQWNIELWSPSREATVALRLAFREPERISRLNAVRLNSFLKENKQSIDFDLLRSILRQWRIENWVESNLRELHRRNRLRISYDNQIIPGIRKILERRHRRGNPVG